MRLQPRPAQDPDLSPATVAATIHPGEYLHSDRELFFVVDCADDWALIEDCHSNALIQVDRDWLSGLQEVRRQPSERLS